MSHPHPPQIVLRGPVRVDKNGNIDEVLDYGLLFSTDIVPLFKNKGEARAAYGPAAPPPPPAEVLAEAAA